MANSGCAKETRPLAEKFLKVFGKYDHVVAPSGSCVSMVRNHYSQWLEGKPGFDHLRANTFELCEYLVDVAGVTKVVGDFPMKVGLHMSCHGLRELRLARSSEQMLPSFNKVRELLAQLNGIELVELTRPDECCGFGGTFAVNEEAVSSLMGRDRIADHLQAGAEVVVGFDSSCLMHLEGIIRREKIPATRYARSGNPGKSEALITGHPEKAALFVLDDERVHWHDQALWFVRLKRDRQAAEHPGVGATARYRSCD